MVDNPLVHTVSKEINLDPGALLASCRVQRGTVVLSKSVTPSRIASNLQVRELSEDAFAKLTLLERHKRFNFPAIWGYDILEEAGEETVCKAALEASPANKIKLTV
ncbi:aldehyde reductase I (ARI) [Penicillium brevicompactum]|uniref:Aldehyde reductase I (ARI) n=1 Tax=Penicillium brevicompactum TaxID=5074 RepID=A0A9W9QY00_PENBR|nr:aldehyde reductase I (ARI) [Penicillium brevicompactum]